MKIVPRTKSARVAFYNTHVEQWAQHASAIGVTEEQCEDLKERIALAKEALLAQQEAAQAAEAATLRADLAIESLHTLGASMIMAMKARAKVSGSNEPYILGMLPIPQKPSETPPLDTPDNFTFALRRDGALIVGWECTQPRGVAGTTYEVQRSLGGPFVHIGTAGSDKRFIDATIPAGTRQATYYVTAVRSNARSAKGGASIQFGIGMAA